MKMIRTFKGIQPKLGNDVYIDESAIVIGDVNIGHDVSIWPIVSIRGDVNSITIGDRSNIQDGSVLHVTHKDEERPDGFPLIIGKDVTVGHKALLHGCKIGDRVLIGMGSIVLDGAIIKDDVFLAAGALVSPGKTLESGFLYRGSPARKIRSLSQKELLFLKESARNYIELKECYIND